MTLSATDALHQPIASKLAAFRGSASSRNEFQQRRAAASLGFCSSDSSVWSRPMHTYLAVIL